MMSGAQYLPLSEEFVAALRAALAPQPAVLAQLEVRLSGIEYSEEDLRYLLAARQLHHVDGDLEIDDNAVVSNGGDEGAYVMCWKWIADDDVAEVLGCIDPPTDA